jgi:hypothetical protein
VRVGNVEARLNAVDPLKDEALFAAHNSRSFAMPLDWKFEPCQGHYDTVRFPSTHPTTVSEFLARTK